MALRRSQKRTPESKLDATPPWDTRPARDTVATTGPFDVVDAPSDSLERVDLGAMRIPVTSGLEVRVEVGENGTVSSVLLLNESGQMQLGVFAAPRTEGIWDDVRDEIRKSITSERGTVQEREGEFGIELTGRVPVEGGFNPMRFIGVNGPKWFLRAMIVGPAALDDAAAKPFVDTIRGVVVNRGNIPLPVREPVPLTLPRDAAEQIAAAVASGQTPPGTQA
jgi:hypothetical protein